MSYDDDYVGERGFRMNADGDEDTDIAEPLDGDIGPMGDMVFENDEEDDDPDNRYH